MKKQRHCWVLEDENGVIKMEMAPFFCDSMVPAFAARGDARDECCLEQMGHVVKYVPENKALIDAAKELVRGVINEEWVSDATYQAAEKLEKALEAK